MNGKRRRCRLLMFTFAAQGFFHLDKTFLVYNWATVGITNVFDVNGCKLTANSNNKMSFIVPKQTNKTIIARSSSSSSQVPAEINIYKIKPGWEQETTRRQSPPRKLFYFFSLVRKIYLFDV